MPIGNRNDEMMDAARDKRPPRRLDTPTLRDQLAMAALTGLVAAGVIVDAKGPFMKATAVSAYGLADAMLEARKEDT